jgi:hypothetical protein
MGLKAKPAPNWSTHRVPESLKRIALGTVGLFVLLLQCGASTAVMPSYGKAGEIEVSPA